MQAIVKRVEGLTFVGKADTNHWVVMDGKKESGGSDAGPSPKELVLIALGAHLLSTGLACVERLEVARRAAGELLHLVLADLKPGPPADLTGRLIKGATSGSDRRQPPHPVRRLLHRQVQDAVGNMQVLAAAAPVGQPRDRHLPKHAAQRPPVTGLDRTVPHASAVRDTRQAVLPPGSQIEMILKQRAQQLAPLALQPGLQLRVLEPRRLLALKPADDPFKPFTSTGKPASRRSRLLPHRLKNPCSPSITLGQRQDFTSLHVKFLTTSAEVGDHAATSVVDVGMSNADFGTVTSFSCGLSPRPRPKPPAKQPPRRPLNRESSTNPGAQRPSTRAAPYSYGI